MNRIQPLRVELRQTWSINDRLGSRVTGVVEGFVTKVGIEYAALRTAAGTVLHVSRRTLSQSLRGARLEKLADGTDAPKKPPEKGHGPSAADRWTPKVKVKLPRGMRALTARDIQIKDLRGRGLGATIIAAQVGVSRTHVDRVFELLDDWARFEASGGAARRAP